MKEATGELNSTLIVVISVGVLMTFFFSYLWPMIRNNFESESQCAKAICDCKDRDAEGKCTCWLKDNESNTFKCVYKG